MKDLNKSQKIEFGVGFALLALVLILGITGVIQGDSVFVRTLIGLGFGFALTRGNFGFAGLSNRVCRTGQGNLIRAMMLTISLASVLFGVYVIATGRLDSVGLWIKPISWGLLVGGLMFGIGMAFSSCCATGVLQDIPLGFTRAMVTLLFFGLGVFLGNPLWSKAFNSEGIKVWFVDWFSNGGTNMVFGVVGAILVTIAIAVGISYLSKLAEKRVAKNFPEPVQEEAVSTTTFNKLFINKWSTSTTALVFASLMFALLVLTGAGWGASTVHGNWFGSILNWIGIDVSSMTGPKGFYDLVLFGQLADGQVYFFADAGSMQNLGIILGAFTALLLSGNFTKLFKGGLKVKPIELVLFAAGGLLMGFGTRLSWGCNVGAFFTPVIEFSLTGWVYFGILLVGGFLGNKVYKAFYKKIS